MKFSEKIVYMRKKRKISQDRLAKKMGVSRQTIYKWEADLNTPEFNKIERLAEILDISYDLLLDDNIDLKAHYEDKNEEIIEEEEVSEQVCENSKRKFLIIGIALAVAIAIVSVVMAILLNNNTPSNTDTGSALVTDTSINTDTATDTTDETDTNIDTSADTETDTDTSIDTSTDTDADTDIVVDNHKWSDWQEIDKGKCNAPQTLERFCVDCKIIETKEGEIVVEHTYSLWSTKSPASCEQAEQQARICYECGEEDVRNGILALGHEYESEKCIRCQKSQYTEGVKYSVKNTYATASFNSSGDTYTDEVISIQPYYTPEGSDKTYVVKIVNVIKSDYVTEVIIPEGVEEIRGMWETPNLVSLKLPSTIKDIQSIAFSNCKNINKVYISNLKGWCALSTMQRDEPIFSSPYYMYLNGEILTDLHITSDIIRIHPYTFANCKSINRLTMEPNEQRMIFQYAFAYSGLQYAQLDGIEVYENAFNSCYSLLSVDVMNLKSMRNSTFSMCFRLVEVYTSKTYIKPGYSDSYDSNGTIAKYAKVVHYTKDEESAITITDEGFVFVKANEIYYLVQYIGNNPIVKLPRNFNGQAYVIAEKFYVGGSPNTRISDVYVPKEIVNIENDALFASQYLSLHFESNAPFDAWEQKFGDSLYIYYNQTFDY